MFILLYFNDQIVCQILLAPFFTWVYVPMLEANFYLGALVGAVYLSIAYLAACPVFEAVTERMSRRFNFEYGQARAWGSLGYAVSALCAGFLFLSHLLDGFRRLGTPARRAPDTQTGK